MRDTDKHGQTDSHRERQRDGTGGWIRGGGGRKMRVVFYQDE